MTLQIELKEEAEFLEFYPEYELSKKPMRIDTLIVKNRGQAGKKISAGYSESII